MDEAIVERIRTDPAVDKTTSILMQAFFDPDKGQSGGIAGYFGVDPATFPELRPFFRFHGGGVGLRGRRTGTA